MAIRVRDEDPHMVTLGIAMEDSVFLATGAPGEWRVADALGDTRPEAITSSAEQPERLLVGTFDSGLQRSTDGGDTFERVGEGVLATSVTSVAVSPHDPAVVWAGTEPSAVVRSDDGGRTWRARPGLTALPSAERWSFPPRPHTHHVRWVEPDPAAPGRLYVGIEAGALVRTDDGGETWQDHIEGARRDNHTLETHPDAPGLVYAAAGDGFAISRDGGDSWTYPQAGLDHRYCWSVVADPADPATLVLSAARSARSAHDAGSAESYVYRRDGEDWQRVADPGLPTGEGVLRPVLATTGEAGVIYAVSNRGVSRSTDAGHTWSGVDLSWPDRFGDQTCRGVVALP